MSSVGEHFIIDFIDVVITLKPSSFATLIQAMARQTNVEIIDILDYNFSPQGYTAIALLKESHISVHTFPEDGIITMDFYSCGQTPPSETLNLLEKHIPCRYVNTRNFQRGSCGVIAEQSAGLCITYQYNDVLLDIKSKFQHIQVYDLDIFGHSLFLDGTLQVSSHDESLYSNAFLDIMQKNTLCPQKIAILGCGDGGLVRECLTRFPESKIDLFELDEAVINASRRFLPTVHQGAFDHPSVDILLGDCIETLKANHTTKYDYMLLDLNTDELNQQALNDGIELFINFLAPNGTLGFHSGDKQVDIKKTLERYHSFLSTHFQQVEIAYEYIPSFAATWYFLAGTRRQT